MTPAQSLALADLAFKAIQAASPKPLDILLILYDGGDDLAASSQLLATVPSSQGEQLRTMLRHYCSALALIVEQCTEPEELIEEIGRVLRVEALGKEKQS